MQQPLKVFIVDDNSLYRRILSMAVEATTMPTVVETAPSGAIALKKIPIFGPDIVLLDIEMPDMNGIEVLKAIRAEYSRVSVVLVSGVNSRSADITIEGLTSGASDFVPKPVGGNPADNAETLRADLERIFQAIQHRREARVTRAAQAASAPSAASAAPRVARQMPSLIPARVEVVAIGISTGGPTALEQLVPALPAALRVPVIIVQHMPPLFTESLAKALDRRSALRVCEAADGQVLERGGVYLAPGGRHLRVEAGQQNGGPHLVARLDDGPPVNSCRPAVDVLFHSLAVLTGRHTLAIVMTGMGQDGLDGVAAIKAQSGYCVTQSEDTCTVYGMPMAIDRAGLSDEQVALDELAGRITSLTGVAAL